MVGFSNRTKMFDEKNSLIPRRKDILIHPCYLFLTSDDTFYWLVYKDNSNLYSQHCACDSSVIAIWFICALAIVIGLSMYAYYSLALQVTTIKIIYIYIYIYVTCQEKTDLMLKKIGFLFLILIEKSFFPLSNGVFQKKIWRFIVVKKSL